MRPAAMAASTSSAVVARVRSLGIPLHEPVDEVDLLEGLGDGEVAGEVARRVDRPELRADATLAQPWEVGRRRRDPPADVEAVEVAADLEPQLPRQVVVSVEHRWQDQGQGAHPRRLPA